MFCFGQMNSLESAIEDGDGNVAELLSCGRESPNQRWRHPLGPELTPLLLATGAKRTLKWESLLAASIKTAPEKAENSAKKLHALHADVHKERLDIVVSLLAAGADPNGKEKKHGISPVACAAELGHSATLRALIESGAAVDTRDAHGGTPLAAAAALGNAECCRLLVAHGADVNAADHSGATPVTAGSLAGQLEALRVLLASTGVDLNAQRSTDGSTPLLLAAVEGRGDIVAALLAAGADPNVTNFKGETAVAAASAAGQLLAVEELIRNASTSLNTSDANGDTPLMVSLRKKHVRIAHALLSSGRDVGINAATKADGATALCLALVLENDQRKLMIARLINAGADPYVLMGGSGGRGQPGTPVQRVKEAAAALEHGVVGPDEVIGSFLG